jgi:hypothetical protein
MSDAESQKAPGRDVSPDPDKQAYAGQTEEGHETEKLEQAAGKKFGTFEEATQGKPSGDDS